MDFKQFLLLEKEGHTPGAKSYKRPVTGDIEAPPEQERLTTAVNLLKRQRDAARKIKSKLANVKTDTNVIESTSIATLIRKRLFEMQVAAPVAAPGVASSTRGSMVLRAMRRTAAVKPKNVQAQQFALNPGSNISQSASLPARPQLSTSK
jgi:hypothetical protein